MINARMPLAALFAFGLSAAFGTDLTPTLSVSPNPAPAGQAFVLTLAGVGSGSCYTAFSRESVTVIGDSIFLRYTSTSLLVPMGSSGEDTLGGPARAGVVCPVAAESGTGAQGAAAVPLNAPRFDMPPLKAGKYSVWAMDMPECLYSQPSCLIGVLPVSAGVLTVQEASPPAYTVSPSNAPAGAPFALQLLSYAFTCATAYDNLSVVVDKDTLVLSFLDHERTGILCPAIYQPYGPTFQIPALAAGTYRIKVNRLSVNAIAEGGSVRIDAKASHASWYLKERTVAANSPFQMQLLHDSLAACTNFSDQSAVVSGTLIYASFLMQTGKCSEISQVPIGPVFSLPALKVGLYPVYPQELVACQTAQPPCYLPVKAPVATDTLVVAKDLAISLSRLRADAPKVELSADRAVFALPAGKAGIWRAVLTTLDGRILADARVAGSAGERVSIPVGRAPAHTLSLLRLISPDGQQRLLPVSK